MSCTMALSLFGFYSTLDPHGLLLTSPSIHVSPHKRAIYIVDFLSDAQPAQSKSVNTSMPLFEFFSKTPVSVPLRYL